MAGLSPVLQEKIRLKFPDDFEEAKKMAKAKDKKMHLQTCYERRAQPLHCAHMDPPQPAHQPPQPASALLDIPKDPHLELLQKVTSQLEDLSINLVQSARAQPSPRNDNRRNNEQPPRRPPNRRQDLHYDNCREDGHDMYFYPHPRRYNGNGQGRGPRRQISPPRDRPPVQQLQQLAEQHQILRRPPQAVAEIPPLPGAAGERAVNVICLEAKGKEKAKIPEIIEVKKKKTQFSDKATGPSASMETEDEAASSKKRKKRSSTR